MNAVSLNRSPFLLCMTMFIVLAGCRSAGTTGDRNDEGWTDLFDGNTLNGWRNPYTWGDVQIVDNEIRLTADQKFFLVTEKPYRDFILEGEIFMPEGQANSGFMFRAHVEPNKVYGYQAEVDPSNRKWFGGLYDEGRRGWLNPNNRDSTSIAAFRKAAGEAFRHNEWNRYRIHAEGDRLRIWVNDVLTTDYRDTTDREGFIGIQHHGEKDKTYRFRNLRIRELTPATGQ